MDPEKRILKRFRVEQIKRGDKTIHIELYNNTLLNAIRAGELSEFDFFVEGDSNGHFARCAITRVNLYKISKNDLIIPTNSLLRCVISEGVRNISPGSEHSHTPLQDVMNDELKKINEEEIREAGGIAAYQIRFISTGSDPVWIRENASRQDASEGRQKEERRDHERYRGDEGRDQQHQRRRDGGGRQDGGQQGHGNRPQRKDRQRELVLSSPLRLNEPVRLFEEE